MLTMKLTKLNSFLAAFTSSTSECTNIQKVPDYTSIVQISSPAYPSYYSNNLDCRTIITGPTDCKWKIEFLDFNLAPESDVLLLHDGDSRNSRQLGYYHQGSITDGLLMSSGNKVWLRFRTDESETGQGFNIRLSPQKYGGLQEGNGSIVLKPQDNFTIPASVFYQIDVLEHSQALFTITNTTMNPMSLLHVHDGLQTTAPLLAVISTSQPYSHEPIAASSNQMLVVACNFTMAKEQFSALYEPVMPGSFYPLTAVSGTFDFTSNWTGGEVLWTIPPRDQDGVVSLRFSQWILPDNSTLTVNQGISQTSPKLIAIRSNSSFVPVINIPTRNGVRILLQGNHGNSSYFSETDTSIVSISGAYSHQPGCGGQIVSSTGQIQTLEYPNVYPLNSQCNWQISSHVNPNVTGQKLHVAFHGFELSSADTLQIFTVRYVNQTVGNHSSIVKNQTLLASYSGVAVPDDVITGSDEVWVNFNAQSLGQIQIAKGFTATYEIIGCGSNITNIIGAAHVETPGYPKPESQDVTCVWVVNYPLHPDTDHKAVNIISFTYAIKNYINSTDNMVVMRDGSSSEDEIFDVELKEGQSKKYLSRTNKLWIKYSYKASSRQGFAFQLNIDNYVCPQKQQCGNRVCMHDDWKCNGVDNCGDGTDEKSCTGTINQFSGVTITAIVLTALAMFVLGILLACGIPALYKRLKYPNYGELRDLMSPVPT